MLYGLQQTNAPAVEPLSIADVKLHARIDASNQEPAPEAPAAALKAPAAAGNLSNGAYRYLATFVTAVGETQAGAPSAAVTVADHTVNGQVAVSGIPLGGSAVTARKLYRTVANGSSYLLLATLSDNTTATFADNVADASLGTAAPSTNTTLDPMISRFVVGARQAAENITRRAFITQKWKLTLDQFPMPAMNIGAANWYGPQWGTSPGPLSTVRPDGATGFEIFVPLPPLQSIDAIKYVDQDGNQQTLDPTQYLVDSVREPARITPAYGASWPQTRNQANAVEVDFTCGYGASGSSVPSDILDWMLMRIATLYENRTGIAIGQRLTEVELPTDFVDGLLVPYRVITF